MSRMSMFFIVSTITLLTLSLTVLAQQQFKLIINGKNVETNMIVKDGVTYLPLKTISGELGMDLEFQNGVISLNSTSQSTKQVTSGSVIEYPTETPTASQSNPTTVVTPPSTQKPTTPKYDKSPLTKEEVLKGVDRSMKQSIELYEGMGNKVTIDTQPYFVKDAYGIKGVYVIKIDDGVESEWKEYTVYANDPIGWRLFMNYERIPTEEGRTWGGTMSNRIIKTEYNKK